MTKIRVEKELLDILDILSKVKTKQIDVNLKIKLLKKINKITDYI